MSPWFARGSLVLALTVTSACDAPQRPLLVEERTEVEASGASRDALSPGFPGERRVELVLPSAAYLRVAPALVTEQDVRRARVSFRVVVEADGESTTVYDETFRFLDANEWHEREIDLTRWSGRRIALVFTTGTPEARSRILWADRVVAVWGEPTLWSSPGRQFQKEIETALPSIESWTLDADAPLVVDSTELDQGVERVVNLLLAGLLGLVVRSVYLRFAATGDSRFAAGNLFPVISVITVLVIILVQSSLALSLGLIGALSIVRFRTAVRTSEELAYLLLCISVGVSLGAERRVLAVAAVGVTSLFVMACAHLWRGREQSRFQLTLSGDTASFYRFGDEPLLERVRRAARTFELSRVDESDHHVVARTLVTVDGHDGAMVLAASLTEAAPGITISLEEARDVV